MPRLAPPSSALGSPELAEPLALLRALEKFAAAAVVLLPPDVPHPGAAETRLAAGVPALAGEPLVDPTALDAALDGLGAVLSGVPIGAEASGVLGAVRAALRDGAVDPEQLLGAALAGDLESLELVLGNLAGDAGPAAVLVDWAVRPALRAGRERVADLLREARWTSGTCPACGALPLLGELRPAAGSAPERMLRCGRCAAAWSAHRVRCVHCGEHRHDRLSYLSGEGERESRRAETCDTCRGYVKTVAVLSPLAPAALAEMDLMTAGLDFVALERGYVRAPRLEALSPDSQAT